MKKKLRITALIMSHMVFLFAGMALMFYRYSVPQERFQKEHEAYHKIHNGVSLVEYIESGRIEKAKQTSNELIWMGLVSLDVLHEHHDGFVLENEVKGSLDLIREYYTKNPGFYDEQVQECLKEVAHLFPVENE